MARPFESTDYYELLKWWADRKISAVPREYMPNTGFIVPGVAAAFMYLTDGKLAIIDVLISNPNTSKEIRKVAVDEVLKRLVIAATDLGYSIIRADVKMQATKDIALRNGFRIVGEYTGVVRGPE